MQVRFLTSKSNNDYTQKNPQDVNFKGYKGLSKREVAKYAKKANSYFGAEFGLKSQELEQNIKSLWNKLEALKTLFKENKTVDVRTYYDPERRLICAKVKPNDNVKVSFSKNIYEKTFEEYVTSKRENLVNGVFDKAQKLMMLFGPNRI